MSRLSLSFDKKVKLLIFKTNLSFLLITLLAELKKMFHVIKVFIYYLNISSGYLKFFMKFWLLYEIFASLTICL